MAYKAIEAFYDRELKRCFSVGDDYPAKLVKKTWLEKLLTGKNRCRRVMLEKCADPPPPKGDD